MLESSDTTPLPELALPIKTFSVNANLDALRSHLLDGVSQVGSEDNSPATTSMLEWENVQDLAEGTIRLINLCVQNGYDTVFFLDKSARPAVWLFKDVWERLCPDTPLPHIRYINTGKDQEDMENAYRDPVAAAELLHGLQTRYHADTFRPKHILVADEFSNSGESVFRAATILSGVFEEAQIDETGIFTSPPQWKYSRFLPYLVHVQERSPVYDEETNKRVWSADDYFVEKSPAPETPEQRQAAYQFREELRNLAQIIAANATERPEGSENVLPLPPRQGELNPTFKSMHGASAIAGAAQEHQPTDTAA